MIKFKYIIGANIELDVVASILPVDPEVYHSGGAEIESVKLNGLYVETKDIHIRIDQRTQHTFESLDDLLWHKAMEIASEENNNEISV